MQRRRLIPTALLVAAAFPASAMAEDTDKQCLRFDSSDKRALEFALAGDTLTVTPRTADEVLRVKTSKRRSVSVTRSGNAYTFDVRTVEGETFELVRAKTSTGKLRLRIRALDAEGDTVRRFEVRVKAFDEVACKVDDDEDEPKGDDDDKGDRDRRGRGRGPETREEREARSDRGEGRGPESSEEREARTDRD